MTVNEAPYEFAQWQADAASGRVKETFACGTAAVVTAIGQIKHCLLYTSPSPRDSQKSPSPSSPS